MQINATIRNLKYKPTLCSNLASVDVSDFLSGRAFEHSSFILNYNKNETSISWWVSPKRTRSYPFARIYDTMNKPKRVTIIPFVKDEGFEGDRDFIQWDTVSFMSLLGVYVIIGYYNKAYKSKRYVNKITKQEFDYKYLKNELEELENYKLDALHWNLNQLGNLKVVAQSSKEAYQNISKITGVRLHGFSGIDERISILGKEIETFKRFSRNLAKEAQNREYMTSQPKEILVEEKAKIIIKNYLGGEYYLTIDELCLRDKYAFLIEKKHSKAASIPSMSDIKDGLLKLILYNNFHKVFIEKVEYKHFPVLGLTSNQVHNFAYNYDKKTYHGNLERVFNEGRENGFLIFLMSATSPESQTKILNKLLKDIPKETQD